MASSRSSDGIQKRTFQLAVRVLKLVEALPRNTAGQVLGRQVIRSATSIGANVEEAQGAQSRMEFARRLSIARSEALETRYWLRLVAAAGCSRSGEWTRCLANWTK